MDEQTVQDIIMIAGMFVLRIGLPLLLMLGLGYLHQYRQRLARSSLLQKQMEPEKEANNPLLQCSQQQA